MKKSKTILRRTQPTSSCRSLVWMDSSRLQSEEQKKCKKLYQKLESTRKIIEIHESESAPQYQKWIHSHFGKQLTALRESQQKLNELDNIVEAVETHCHLTGCPPWKAYESVILQQNSSDEPEDDPEEDLEEFYQSAFEAFAGPKKKWRSRHFTYEQAYEEFKEEVFQQSHSRKEQEEEPSFRHRPLRPAQKQTTEPEASSQIKDHYRKLARKLHPDLNEEHSPKMTELWYEVQNAYESRDLSRLETLSALCEISDQKFEKIEGISILRKLWIELKKSISQIEKKIRLAKKEKAWDFYKKIQDKNQMNLFAQEIAHELQLQTKEIKKELEELEYLIQIWKTPTKKERRQKNSRSHRNIF